MRYDGCRECNVTCHTVGGNTTKRTWNNPQVLNLNSGHNNGCKMPEVQIFEFAAAHQNSSHPL